ncbi:SDR family NAD(P)-dependent oxidoreductase [Naasia sp. SYSU D00057]|uniref:SDR family NAD(P)-dependent oxidoreductase n=1 Tax=Naasia sp. SYSU D00057 TaxID=2817380 RepID=UPI001B30278E|nr:SDR family oxidoreductase [Naasia sp. SYSU D00057]
MSADLVEPVPTNGARSARHVLVTGGSRGIGAAIVRAAVADGCRVTFTYSQDADGAEALAADLGPSVLPLRSDVRETERAAGVIAAAVDGNGPLTALVNNAGITGGLGRFADSTDEVLRDVFAVNVLGVMALSRAVVAEWSRSGAPGVIVNLSSVAARTGSPGEYIGYAASKAAVDAFTLGLGREVAGQGIRVVGVSPGTTDTTIHAAGGDPDRLARVAARIPLGRVATPEEIADAVLWALSDRAAYVTATTIAVAGGL